LHAVVCLDVLAHFANQNPPRFTNEVPHLLYGQVLWEDTTDNLILRNAAGFWR